MALPWLGVGFGIVGGWQVSRADAQGWWLIGIGAICLIADLVIDLVWAHPTVSKSDQPHLNRPAEQLVGRVLVVAEAIEHGRGKVRVGDTVWPVEGPDAPSGAEVRVTAANGTVLLVDRVPLQDSGSAC
jgi:membrane protein implicated in regulation of membrane protease activity